ncbi:hypothetical protein [uncultured Methanolobus sp.]|uniref:hypothetical protein n=1 Tax=uncultured Methanolobus sp. TaxID=218300 RepID=UPI002AAC2A6A|nr:hypothetical protein [uncultured Methanolobus sp.]
MSVGCIEEQQQAIEENTDYAEENTVKKYTDIVVDKNYGIYPTEKSTSTTITGISTIQLYLQEGDEIIISVTDVTGGNEKIGMRISESDGFKTFEETTITKEDTYKWIVPQTDSFHFSFDSVGIESKGFHVKIEVTYESISQRYWSNKYIE